MVLLMITGALSFCIFLKSNIIKRFRILRNLLLFFEFRYYPFYYYYYSVFSESPFARKYLRNRNAFSHQTSHTCRPSPLIVHLIFFERIRITILDLEPNPCFQTFLIISKTYYRIFNCNTSKRRSGQELTFILKSSDMSMRTL